MRPLLLWGNTPKNSYEKKLLGLEKMEEEPNVQPPGQPHTWKGIQPPSSFCLWIQEWLKLNFRYRVSLPSQKYPTNSDSQWWPQSKALAATRVSKPQDCLALTLRCRRRDHRWGQLTLAWGGLGSCASPGQLDLGSRRSVWNVRLCGGPAFSWVGTRILDASKYRDPKKA